MNGSPRPAELAAGLPAALARARSAEPPGPDTAAGPAVRAWPGPARPVPEAGPGELDLRALLRLSLAASDRTGRLRPAPSAGALHPVDAELVTGDGCPLPPGRYGYDPLRDRVHHLGPPPGGTPPGVRVELSVTPRRTVSHYGHRAWPLLLLDTGHALAAVCLAAGALGPYRAVTRMDGHECGPLACVHLTAPGPADRDRPPLPPTARRSAPPEALRGTPSPDALGAVLATAVRAAAGELRWSAAVGKPRPGLLRPGPDGRPPRWYATGEARPTLAAWAAGQAWLADAGAVLLAHGCPSDADAARVRRTHLHAGYAVHLADATARRHGLATRPVGSWQRADLGAALGTPPGRDWIVHALALGTGHAGEGRGL
ncbi:SagB/ThcOx family dehydrogenase [Streptomyces sp. NPDC000134]|uniref:SagB/ThcOx family dehydrogenase n=1 Tax=Streptomyces sp. NPDC000134 TaxID=3364536 RepID=UPI0036CFFC79